MASSGEPPNLPPTRALHPVFGAGQRRFGRFVLERLLGRGRMGVVWQARDELLGETVALKFLIDPLICDPRAIADLQAETRRARQLAHPNIVRIHDFFADETGAALSMEYVEGRSLAATLAEKSELSPDEILAWLAGLCSALDYAQNEAHVVHRDFKPGNVMLSAGGAKLADLGVSCRSRRRGARTCFPAARWPK
jgi:serine/threonine protein kinase